MRKKPSQDHPWRKSFDKDWNDAHKITLRKKLHYDKTLEDNMKYMNYVKTRRTI